jgi:hypothetical protein
MEGASHSCEHNLASARAYSLHRPILVTTHLETIMDRYSKVILTIIAMGLLTIVLQNAGVLPSARLASLSTSALANDSGLPQKVQICGWTPQTQWDCAGVQGGQLLIK